MIGRGRDGGDEPDDADDADGATSPWATEEIVAGPAPEFDWDPPSDDTDHEPHTDEPESHEPESHEPVPPDGTGRRNRALIAVGGVAALVVATLIFWPSGDEPLDEADDGGEPVPTLDTLPDPDADADGNDDSPESESDSESEGDESDSVSSEGVLAETPDGVDQEVTNIDLPGPVAAITEPTELVLVAGSDIVTVSLPSGAVRRIAAIPPTSNGSRITVAPDAAAWFGSEDLTIVPRGGPPMSVDIGADSQSGGFVRDWVTNESGSTLFLVETSTEEGSQQYTVSVDGDVEAYEPDTARIDTFAFFGGLRSGAGNELVNDAGGVYVIDADDDAERISQGRALASNEEFVLLRECDEALQCGYVVLDRSTGERKTSPATTEQLGASYGFDLSPDGETTLTLDYDSQRRRLVDLVDGAVVTEAELASSSGRDTQWAADSSGIFQPDPSGAGLVFVDRTTGESVQFGADLGRVTQLGVRIPDAELDSNQNVVATRPITLSDELPRPAGLDVVVLGAVGTMGHLDLEAATASVWSVPATVGSGPPDLVASGPRVFAISSGGRRGFVSEFGSTEPLGNATDALRGSPRFPGPQPGLVWTPRDGRADGVDHRLLVVDELVDPEVGGVTVANSELLGEDGNGRLVARVAGGIFVVGIDEQTKLADGDLLALGANHALVRSCDAELVCSVARIDRSTGESIDDIVLDAPPVGRPDASPGLGTTMSPDGALAILRPDPVGNAEEWVLAFLASDERFVIPTPVPGQPIIWSDDSSTAVYLSDDGVTAVDRTTGRSQTVGGLGEVVAITAVDPSFVEPAG